MITLYLGSVGLVLLLISGVPQIIKLYKTKSSNDISLLMYLSTTLGVFFLLLHAIAISDLLFIATNGLNLISLSIAVFLIIIYRRQK